MLVDGSRDEKELEHVRIERLHRRVPGRKLTIADAVVLATSFDRRVIEA
jgi:hypothetical protein